MCHYFRVWKNFVFKRVMSRFSVENFCLKIPKHFVEEPFFNVFQKVSGCEKIYGKEGVGEEEEGSITIFCRKFFSHSAAKLRRGTVLCCVSQKFRLRKSLWIRGRRKYQDFPAKIFCLAVAKNAVVESFSLP